MTTPPNGKLDTVRKLLAKAEDQGTTPQEAEALTAKAAELMARHGIDRALLAASRPETDKPANRIITIDNPWAGVKALLLGGLASAMRCQAIDISIRGDGQGQRVHVFGFQSDLERLDVLYTSLLLQMTSGLTRQQVPYAAYVHGHAKSWRRSWMVGFTAAAVARVKQAEASAVQESAREQAASGASGPGVELVLADRSLAAKAALKDVYPKVRNIRTTVGSAGGYGAGHAAGQRADIGGTGVRAGAGRALGR
jgi:hypothetical protein